MKLILKFLFVLISIATMILITALFVQKEISVKEALTIDKPIEEVFDYVKLISHQKKYSAWQSKQESKQESNNPSDGNVGYLSPEEICIESVGKGRFKIVEIVPNELIRCAFVNSSGHPLSAELIISTESLEESITLCSFELSVKESYPYNIKLLFSKMPSTESTSLQKSVKKLKVILESQE